MDEILFMICDCENRAYKMTDAETKFIKDLKAKIVKSVTRAQWAKVNVIWDRVTK